MIPKILLLIEVPDLGIFTEANGEGKAKGTMADAIMMARDAIGLTCMTAEDEGREVAEPSRVPDVDGSKGAFYEEGTGKFVFHYFLWAGRIKYAGFLFYL